MAPLPLQVLSGWKKAVSGEHGGSICLKETAHTQEMGQVHGLRVDCIPVTGTHSYKALQEEN